MEDKPMSAPMKQSLSEAERARYAVIFDNWAEEVLEITLERFADIRAPEPTAAELLLLRESARD
jgi:hypothetical protein